MSHLFVSYATHDQHFAIHLFRWLAEAGIRSVVDSQAVRKSTRKSTNGHFNVDHSIEEAFAVIVIMTPEARTTEHVTYEWAYALGVRKPVIPLLLEPMALHPSLRELPVLDFSTDHPDWDTLMTLLHQAQAQHRSNRMVDALQNPNWETRMVAAEILGRRGDVNAIPLLGGALTDPALEVRSAAAQALGQIGDAAAVPYLKQGLADPVPEVQVECIRALSRMGAESAVKSLIHALRAADTRVRWNAAWALGEMGMVALPGLMAAIGDPNEHVRGTAIGALATLGVTESVPELVRALADEDWAVREAAARALGQMEDAAAVHGLVAALYDPDDRVRGTAGSALAAIGSPAVPALRNLLDEPDLTVRLAAVGAFGAMPLHKVDRRVLFQALAQAIQDEAPAVRATAAWGLGQLDNAAIGLLAVALRDRDERVRAITLRVLRRIDSPEARATLADWEQE